MTERIHDRDVRLAYWAAQAAHDAYYRFATEGAVSTTAEGDHERARTLERLENTYLDRTGQLLAVLNVRIGDQPPGPPSPPPMPFRQFA